MSNQDNNTQPTEGSKALRLLIAIALVAAGMLAGYKLMQGFLPHGPEQASVQDEAPQPEEQTRKVRIYFPIKDRLLMQERTIKPGDTAKSFAKALITEFLAGPTGQEKSNIPPNTALRGLYFGYDGVLYVDFSEDFSGGFQGDAMSEFMLLRGLYETLVSNLPKVSDIKILLAGREVDSIGGHILVMDTLSKVVSISLEQEGK